MKPAKPNAKPKTAKLSPLARRLAKAIREMKAFERGECEPSRVTVVIVEDLTPRRLPWGYRRALNKQRCTGSRNSFAPNDERASLPFSP